jgi:hypothetical protein
MLWAWWTWCATAYDEGVRAALEGAGMVFITDDNGGPGVCLPRQF